MYDSVKKMSVLGNLAGSVPETPQNTNENLLRIGNVLNSVSQSISMTEPDWDVIALELMVIKVVPLAFIASPRRWNGSG